MDKKLVEKVGDIIAFPFVILAYVFIQVVKLIFFSIAKIIDSEVKRQNGKKPK